jgi:hypothetical protein
MGFLIPTMKWLARQAQSGALRSGFRTSHQTGRQGSVRRHRVGALSQSTMRGRAARGGPSVSLSRPDEQCDLFRVAAHGIGRGHHLWTAAGAWRRLLCVRFGVLRGRQVVAACSFEALTPPGVYSVPSRQSANRTLAIFRASATIAIRLPRRCSTAIAHCTNGSDFLVR